MSVTEYNKFSSSNYSSSEFDSEIKLIEDIIVHDWSDTELRGVIAPT